MKAQRIDGQEIVTCPRCGATGLVFGGWVLWNSDGVTWLDHPGREGMETESAGCGYDVDTGFGGHRNGYWASHSRMEAKDWEAEMERAREQAKGSP